MAKTIFNMADGIITHCNVARSWHWFRRWLHPAMCHVALESWQWIHQVAAPCNVIRCSGMICHWIRPNVRHIRILHLVSISTNHRSRHVILHQSPKFYPNRTTVTVAAARDSESGLVYRWCPSVCLSVCLSPKCKKMLFSQKLSNLELRCPLMTYRKSHMGFPKTPIIGSLKSKMAEIRHLENRHDVIFYCRWCDLDSAEKNGVMSIFKMAGFSHLGF